MKTRGMIVMHRMAKFVNDYIIPQMLGQSHQKKAQRQGIARSTRSPFGACGPNRKSLVGQPQCFRYPLHTLRKIRFSHTSQLFDPPFALLFGKRRRLPGSGSAGSQSFAGATRPIGLLLEKFQRPRPRHPARIGKPDVARSPYRQRDAARTRRLHAVDRSETGMLDGRHGINGLRPP